MEIGKVLEFIESRPVYEIKNDNGHTIDLMPGPTNYELKISITKHNGQTKIFTIRAPEKIVDFICSE